MMAAAAGVQVGKELCMSCRNLGNQLKPTDRAKFQATSRSLFDRKEYVGWQSPFTSYKSSQFCLPIKPWRFLGGVQQATICHQARCFFSENLFRSPSVVLQESQNMYGLNRMAVEVSALSNFENSGALQCVGERIEYPCGAHPVRTIEPEGIARRGKRTRVRVNDSEADTPSKNGEKAAEQNHEIRVCVNKSCRRSGSLQTLEIFRSLAPPNVSVESSGCIGKCGRGPNLVILPAEIIISHCNTPAHAARLLALQCGTPNPDNNLQALALKQQANKSFEQGDHLLAEKLYTEAIELKPSGGLHFIYSNRSALRLARGNLEGSLEDAKEAAMIAPRWAQAFVRQADAYAVMGNVMAASSACSTALQLDPSLRRSKSFKKKYDELKSRVAPAGASA